jgi:hypothetical protein
MDAQDELNREPSLEAEAGRATDGDAQPAQPAESRNDPVEKPAGAAEPLAAAPRSQEAEGNAPTIEPPRLHLVPYAAPSRAGAAGGPPAALRWASGLAAGLALIAAVTGVGLYDHARQASLLAVKAEESRDLAQTVRTLKDQIDAVEAAQARDRAAELRKVAAEMKTQSGAAHDLGSALAQLTARLDRVEHDQSALVDKLTDRIDHETAARLADLAGRIDKLEKKPPAVVAVAPTPPTPSPRQAALAPKPDPGVSDETTGSIERPRAPLRGYWLVDVQDGFALVDGRDGPRQVAPGDFLPGAGRVLRIERRGRAWVVVTSAGIIVGDSPRF